MRSSRLAFGAALVAAFLAALPFSVFAADPAPGTNCHTATSDEIEAGALPGRPVCDEDKIVGVTANAGQAKAYLLSIARNLRNSQAPPTKERIDALNNAFAICSAKFLKAYKDQYAPVYVVSAFRCGPNSPATMTCDRTENGRAGGAGGSNHQYGLAMDVNPANGNYEQLHAFAKANPQFGVWFRLGMGDPPHLEPTNKNKPSCDGVEGVPVATPIAQSGSDLSNAIRRAMGMQQPPPPPPPMQQPAQQMQPSQSPPPLGSNNSTALPPGTCSPQFYCSNSTYYYRTSSCVDQAYQQCPNGCDSAGQTCSLSSSILNNLVSTPTSTAPGAKNQTPASTTDSSSFDSLSSLDAYLNPVSDLISVTEIGTATPSLNGNIDDIAMVSEETGTTASQRPALAAVASSSAYAPQISGQQTFTSNDLANSPGPAAVTAQNSFVYQTLETLRNVLLYILNIVKPFGSHNPQTTYSE